MVGTHALLQPDVEFRDLALVVIDEQHRFGVEQRLAPSAKGRDADTLLMSATPIPRTRIMALTEVSRLTEKLPGRRRPTPASCRSNAQTRSSSRLPGHVKAGDKDGAMAAFARGAIDLLVATTVMLYQSPLGAIAKRRLAILRQTEDGFRIAEEDLRLRGGGEVLGAMSFANNNSLVFSNSGFDLGPDGIRAPRYRLPRRKGRRTSRWLTTANNDQAHGRLLLEECRFE